MYYPNETILFKDFNACSSLRPVLSGIMGRLKDSL